MAHGINKVVQLYQSGLSIPDISKQLSIPLSTIRSRLKSAGVLRIRAEALKLAASQGKLSSNRGKSRAPFSKEWRENMSIAKLKWARKHANGIRINSKGYEEYTQPPNKGRAVHVVAMEKHIGRPLKECEHIHHIDGDKTHNSIDNLALVTRAGHARLHRYQEKLAGNERRRNKNGTWS